MICYFVFSLADICRVPLPGVAIRGACIQGKDLITLQESGKSQEPV